MLGFCNVYPFRFSYVADHFQYLASLGVIVLASAGAARWLARWGRVGPTRAVLGLTLLAVLASLTWRQSRMYTDIEQLYRTTIAANPTCWMAYTNFGNIIYDKPGQLDEATGYFQKALALNPDMFEAHNSLAVVFARRGKIDQAVEHYQAALRLKPDLAPLQNNFGKACSLAAGSTRPRRIFAGPWTSIRTMPTPNAILVFPWLPRVG